MNISKHSIVAAIILGVISFLPGTTLAQDLVRDYRSSDNFGARASGDRFDRSIAIAELADGRSVATWVQTNDCLVRAQLFDRYLQPVGAKQVIGSDQTESEPNYNLGLACRRTPVIAALSDGGFVIAYNVFYEDTDISRSDARGGIFRSRTPRFGLSTIHIVEHSGELTPAGRLAEVHRSRVNDNRLLRNPDIAASGDEFVLTYNFCDCQPTARFEPGQIPMLWNVAVVNYGADWTGAELAEEMRQPSEEFYPARIPDGCTIDRRDVFRRYDEDSSYDAEYDPANVVLNIFTGGGWAWFGILYETIEEEPLRTPPGETIYWDIWDIECATRPGPVYSAGPPSIAFSDEVYALTWAELDFAGDGVELTGLRAFYELGSTGRTRIPDPLFNTLSIDTDTDGNARERGYTRLPCFNYQTINYMPQASQRPNFRLSYRADDYVGETFGNAPEQIQGTTWDQQGNLYFITTHMEPVTTTAEVVTKNSCIHGRNFNAVSGPGFDLTNQPAGVRFLAPRVEVVQEAGLVDGSNPQFRIVAEAREGSRQASIYTFDTSCSDRRACLIDQFDLPVLVPSDVPNSTQWADPRIVDLRRHEHTVLYNDYGQRARQYQLTGADHVNWNLTSEGSVSRSLYDVVDGRFGVLGVTFEFGSGYQLTTHSVRRRLSHGGDSLSRGSGSVAPGTLTALHGGGFAAVEFDSSSFESSQRFSLLHATSPEETPRVIDTVQTGIIGFGNNPTTSLAAFPGGGFISVWTSALPSTELNGPAHSVRAQRYDANGERSGPEILVDEIPSGNFAGQVPRAVTLSDGGFIIAATSPRPTSTTRLLWEARYDSSGNLLRRRNLRSDVASSDFALLRLASDQIILGWENEDRWLVWDISHDQPVFLRSYETGSIAGMNSFIPFNDQTGFLVVSLSTSDPDGRFLINAHGEDGRHYRSVEINLNSYSGAHDNWLFDGSHNFRVTPADQGYFYAFWLQREEGQAGLTLYSQLLAPDLTLVGSPRRNALDFWLGTEFHPLDRITGNISRADLSVARLVDGRYAVSFELPGGGYSGSRTIFLRAPVIQPYFGGLPYYQNGNFVANLTSDGIALGDVSVLVNTAVENATLTNVVAGSESVEFSLAPLEEGPSTFDIGLRSTIPDLIVADPDPLHVIVDFTAPTAQITSDASGVIGGPFDIHMQFDEPVVGFNFDVLGTGNLAVQNGAVSNFEATSLSAYRATITPESSGPVRVNISSDFAVDRAGNGNVAAPPFTVIYDNEPPSVTGISGPDGLVNGSFTATVAFSEPVSGFSLSGFVVTNGVASNLQAINASTYSATITPISDGQTSVTISAGAAQDSVGNPNRASIYFLIVTVDQTPPTLTLSTTATSPTSSPFTVTATFNEWAVGFALTDFVVGNGSAANFQAVSTTVYTATVTPAADGVVTIDVADGAASDAAGNPSTAAAQLSVTFDGTAPDVTLSTTASSPASGPFTVTATTSEDVTGFDVTDLVIGNGSAANFQAVSATIYAATVTPAADGVVTIDVAAGAASDAAGNSSTAAAQLSVTSDSTRPGVTLTGPAGLVNGENGADIVFTFSENIIGFDPSQLVISGGDWVSGNSGDGLSFTVKVFPTADGVMTVDYPANSVNDAAGNSNTAAGQYSVTTDISRPTVAITGVPSTTTGAFTATFTFSEAVTGFEPSSIQLGVGLSASNFQAVSTSIYSALITPTVDTNSGLSVAACAARDVAGNCNDASANVLVAADITPPTLVSIQRASPTSSLTNADQLGWRMAFSEPVSGIDAADFTVTGTTASVASVNVVAAALPEIAGAGTGIVPFAVAANIYDITVSGGDLPGLNGVVTIGFAPGQNITDSLGNALAQTVPTGTNQPSFTVDNLSPTVTIASDATGPVSGPITFTILFSEPVSGFGESDIVVTNAAILSGSFGGDGASYTGVLTPLANGPVTIDVAAAVADDAAGNQNVAATQFSIVSDIDTVRTLTVTRTGPGTGVVTSEPAGINCGGDCTASYAVGSDVNLIAVADPGSSFASWTGDDCVDPLSTICIARMTINQAIEARFILDAPAPSHIIAAVLPGARSGYVDGLPVSAFLTVMNPTAIPAQSCLITIPSDAPLAQSYFQLDTNGDPVGPENPLFDINPGGALNFVIAMTATAQTGPDGYSFMPVITCQNASLDPIVGVNDILLNIGAAPTPDILSIAATPSSDGVIRIPAAGGIQFMSASALNIGAGDGLGAAGEVTLTATVDTGSATLPLNLEICRINASAICTSPRGGSVTTTMPLNTPLFFAVFVRDTSTGGIAFDPANARVFLRFADATGTIRSATSAAVTAPAPAAAPGIASSLPTGRWSVLMRQPDDGQTPSLVRTTLFVMGDGRVMIDDGIEPRLTTVASIAADNDDGTQARFSALGHDGVWTSAGSIRLGSPWAEQVGEFWGVRDARSEAMLDWLDFPGRYGATPHGAGIEISASGSIRGTVAGCIVSGQADQGVAASVTLTSCSHAGLYSAILDTPANDHDAPALLIANGTQGWRLER